ncbi:MAG TPA: hypothetical protein VD789_01430, partial [Thermomicrobiales bacterium]|nr:hypothetical protein [Thermomicrobiales bacterium]
RAGLVPARTPGVNARRDVVMPSRRAASTVEESLGETEVRMAGDHRSRTRQQVAVRFARGC